VETQSGAVQPFTPSIEHRNLVALQWASGERSTHRIALNLQLPEPYVDFIRTLDSFQDTVLALLPEAKPVERPFEDRLRDAKQDALTHTLKTMRTATHERTRLRAAEVILNADRRAQSTSSSAGGGFILPAGEADRIVETRIQVR